MKIGIITDIHNNLTALKAVIKKLNELECDQIICCGDIIGIGPCPEETVQYIMQIPNIIAVRGNHEKYLLDGMPSAYPNDENMSIQEMEHHKWEHNLLSAESICYLKSLPYRADMEYDRYKVSAVHYCMDDMGNFVNYKQNPTTDDLDTMFANLNSDIVLYGHNHCRHICKGDKWYINVGSLGCPAQDKNKARAGVLTIEKENVQIESLDIEYDVREVIDLINKLNYPDSDNIKKYFYGIW